MSALEPPPPPPLPLSVALPVMGTPPLNYCLKFAKTDARGIAHIDTRSKTCHGHLGCARVESDYRCNTSHCSIGRRKTRADKSRVDRCVCGANCEAWGVVHANHELVLARLTHERCVGLYGAYVLEVYLADRA